MSGVSNKGGYISVVLVAVTLVTGLTWCLLPSDAARKAESTKALRSRKIKLIESPAKKVQSRRIDESVGVVDAFKGFGGASAKGEFGWKDGEDPFATMPSFDFDDEDMSLLSDELRGILKQMSFSFASTKNDKKRVFAAVQKLLAMMRFRNEAEAFDGSFELLPCSEQELKIRRCSSNGDVAELHADFAGKSFRILHNGSLVLEV